MPGPGKRFEKGHDARRNVTGGSHGKRSKTLRQLAQGERQSTLDTLKELRDEAEDERVRLEAAKTIAAYSDGKPRETAEATDEEKPDEDEKPPAGLFAVPPPEEQT